MRLFIIIIFLLSLVQQVSAQVKNVTTIQSPNGRLSMAIDANIADSSLAFSVSKDGELLIDSAQSRINLKGNPAANLINTAYLRNVDIREIRDTIKSRLWERKYQPDYYTEARLRFRNDSIQFIMLLRIYNEGIASMVSVNDPGMNMVDGYYTTYHWTHPNLVSLFDSKCESGYHSVRLSDEMTALTPNFALSFTDSLMVLTNEAANYEFFSRAKVDIYHNGITLFQRGLYKIGQYATPWHYVVFSRDAKEYLEGRYIVRSLNTEADWDYSWVRPGRVFRHPGNDPADFATVKVQQSMEFAKKMGFEYVLLDNGWYGMGYSGEFDNLSDPSKPVEGLGIKEVIGYADRLGLGVLLYVNKTAFLNFGYDSLLTVFKNWGAKGIKTGFLKNNYQQDNVLASRVITKCAQLGMVVNVHDHYRPTGIERMYPNLLTCEGLRGNEYRDNDASHTTTLPFVRFMSGAADYTICYDAAGQSRLGLSVSKCHQMALSVIYFSPLQHLFWYGEPSWYVNDMEVEFFKELPTVWDDYKIITAFPRKVFSMARQNDGVWYVASIAADTREIEIPVGKLTNRKSTATIYEDTESGGILRRQIQVSPSDTIKINVKANGGNMVIIK